MNQNPFPYPLSLGDIEDGIEKLPPLHRVAFAASICERMLPNYSAFFRRENWGNFSRLRKALDEIWQILQGNPLNVSTIHQLKQACDSEEVIPNSDDFPESRYDGEAREAVLAILHTLDACLDPCLSCIINIINCALNTIDLAVYSEYYFSGTLTNDIYERLDEEVVSHPWMLRELAKQREDLKNLKNIKTLSREFLERLRHSFNNNGKSLIDVG